MKRIILVAFLFAFTLNSWSQSKVSLSFNGDPSINWMSSSNPLSTNEKTIIGFDFGLNADIFFSESERYALLTGVQIVNTGGELTYTNNNTAIERKFRLRYVEIPLAIKLKTDQFRRNRYWCEFGLSPMINIGAKGTSADGKLSKTDVQDDIYLFNVAMLVGLGFDFDLGGNNSITTGLVFQNGLTDVTKDISGTDKTIINSLKLKIGLIF